eukprot:gene24841-33326_t
MAIIRQHSLFYNIWLLGGQSDAFSLLDIGCNEGDLSMELLQLAKSQLPEHVRCTLIGIDLDSSLIDLANEKYKHGLAADTVDFRTVDIMNEGDESLSNYMSENNIQGFSFVSLFSITMWIHLNFGTDGLDRFLLKSVSLLDAKSGYLLIEPQPWKCYKNAVKRCRKLGMAKPLYYDTIQNQNIEEYIIDLLTGKGGLVHRHLGIEQWGRSIMVFHTHHLIWFSHVMICT